MNYLKGPPLVFEIKHNSLEDGPGIRSVIFFKGCPLNCVWCHNPESKQSSQELSYEKCTCMGCLSCVQVCRFGALKPGNIANQEPPVLVNREKCQLCLKCVEVCPTKTLTLVGEVMSIDEILAKVIPYRTFFEVSGGGVTVSGGEPTQNLNFLSQLLKKLKEENINTLIETNGLFNLDSFVKQVLPFVDTIFMDIKMVDDHEHQELCGVSNQIIKDNFLSLHQLAKGSKFTIIPRTPLIPNLTDREDQIYSLAKFYQANGVTRAALLKNNPLWLDKTEKLGLVPQFTSESPLRGLYDSKRFQKLANIYREQGIEVVE